ncbi:BREX-1 system adenine-specific DNA-methyltransferase PglX [Polaromonas sp. C04]|uniref:BREX-1 system adenine-specific DNA-methyltransferase PglX n=1 Tax=Polaromonas sp. C04 TaxID=1945857 RepID=UPI000986633F|nr:BREX-1 system adenine-specific DNA-methyltransferase PglX [Polaromonas sp. C04]OOG58023.1 SAM-dependent methyltransferase [Polaromonas sp. C04]
MNKAKLKSYAPQARKDFIAAVTARANLLGLSDKAGKLEVAASLPQGDVTVIAGQAWPVKVHSQRDQLVTRIRKDGFSQTMEAVAYTWFNRFAALRYLELHDYLSHGHRALSSTAGTLPDILTHATDLAQSGSLPGLNFALVTEMKLAGNRDGELYSLLLVAQCNVLSAVMPFLFERIDDETELLLPDNLLRTDSVIAKLVTAIDEDDWKEVEIIGWLYQFYISEKKEDVIGKVVKSEDIPAATQLFTPNWIVQYLVQNSVGRLWLMANPASTLKAQWPYYIEPAQQTPEVQAQLDALIQTRMDEDGGSLDPESITLLDPACGSGHILVEAYEVLKAIYLERGYQPRTIPRLILEKNLYGLDLDDRAAQMAGFALLMKARADDRRLFNEPIKLNVLALQESKGLELEEVAAHLSPFGIRRAAIKVLVDTFALGKTLGSLIQIPQELKGQLTAIADCLKNAAESGDLYSQATAVDLIPLVAQARIMGMLFDTVAANPPYMGGKGMNPVLKEYARSTFTDSKSDLFAMFIEQGFAWCKDTGFTSMVTMQNWMFLSSYEMLRNKLLAERSLLSLVQLPYDGKGPTAMGINFGVAVVDFQKWRLNGYRASFDCLRYFELTADGTPKKFPSRNERNVESVPDYFQKLPGSPVAYWVSDSIREAFGASRPLSETLHTRLGMSTASNERFLRYWHEVSIAGIGFNISNSDEAFQSHLTWFPYQKGGVFRKWFGNCEHVVNWKDDGVDIRANVDEVGRVRSHNYNAEFGFREGITWSDVTSGSNAFRYMPPGFMFDGRGSSGFSNNRSELLVALAVLNSRVSFECIAAINPTIAVNVGEIAKIPLHPAVSSLSKDLVDISETAIEIAKSDWDTLEQSWDYSGVLMMGEQGLSLSDHWLAWSALSRKRIERMLEVERSLNRLLVGAYRVSDVVRGDVPEAEITLTRADREKDCQRLMSYAIGCMMGRYSLDAPGLICAHAGNVGFDASSYTTFPADADGIVPLSDELWFEDDAASRIREFLLAVWSADTLTENMAWLAESLGTKASETPDETIRRYLADKFYKDHLQTYKRRPIYWLFSSGKQGAFQALVYLHRYHEGTLARLRAEYVVPLTGKIQSRIDMLQKDAASATSTAARNKLAKEVEKLKKKHVELLAYDEQLRHYADMRITLDLDDGVKVNYGKFGDLLAEVKAVTGGAGDD